VPQRGPPSLPSRTFKAMVPNYRSQPKSGSWGFGIGLQEGFMGNLTFMKFTSSHLEANALPNQHMYEILDLTSNIDNLILFISYHLFSFRRSVQDYIIHMDMEIIIFVGIKG